MTGVLRRRSPRPVRRRPLAALVAGILVAGASGGGAACGGSTARAEAASRDTALARIAGELLPAAEDGSGLRARRPVRLARSGRSSLEGFVTRELRERLPPERARAVRDGYARLGLLPPDLDLFSLLRSVYLEGVVGYYDPASDTLFVREGVEGASLGPVLVHELVHALQDQAMDLDSLMEAREGRNDASAAARAALEGHATFVMIEWQLRRMGAGEAELDLARLPDLGALLSRTAIEELGAPALAGAPAIVQESLLFPYLGGLAFVQRLWRAEGGRLPPLGDDLPESTEQILHLDRYLGSERDAPTELRLGPAPEGWRRVHADGLGEFEVRVLLEELLADTARARAAAAGWDGDRWELLRGEAGEALVWASVWDGRAEAEEFGQALREALARRDGAAGEDRRWTVAIRSASGRPAVVAADVPVGVDPGPLAAASRVRAVGGR